MIDLAPQELQIVKDILQQTIPHCSVWAFGSRVKGTARPFSDLDLVILSQERLDWRLIEQIKDRFSASSLPFMVDLVDWQALDESFRKLIQEKYEVIQTG